MNAYSFTAGADYRVYAATMTGFSGGSTDPLIDLIASNGPTVLEPNDQPGEIGTASYISGTVLIMAGTYYVRVGQLNTVSLFGSTLPYEFYVRVLPGSPAPGTEPNDRRPRRAVRSNCWTSGGMGRAVAEHDTFAIAAEGGDMVVSLVDVDPRRDPPEWKTMTGIGVFNGSFIMINGERNPR